MVEELPAGYYLDNFLYLVKFVRGRYEDVLNQRELKFCDDFAALSDDAKKALVRLLGRTHTHIREDKCQYSEIADFRGAVHELHQLELVNLNPFADPMLWLELATKPELLNAFAGVSKSVKKLDLCCEINERYTHEQIIEQLEFDIIEPTCHDVLEVFKLLFFGNLYQDLTEFVLHDLGVTPYESYALDSSGRYFNERSLLEAMLEAYRVQAASEEVMQNEDFSLAEFAQSYLLPIEVTERQLERRYSKVFNRVARQLERESELALALELYEKSSVPPARERRARILAGEGNIMGALQLCRQILDEPMSEAEYEFATGFAFRTSKKLDAVDVPEWIEAKPKDAFALDHFELSETEFGVEESVAEYFRNQGAVAEHVENGLLPGLFGLLFWPAIFAPVKGVFFNPFQRGPADLYSQEFRAQRETMLAKRFSLLGQPDELRSTILATYAEKYGLANNFVMWRSLNSELIELALDRIPSEHLTVIFERLMRDLKGNRSGFPDLVVFPGEGGYELVEVKGPGDVLQNNQKRWLRCFGDHDIPASVVHVTWKT